MCAALPIDLVNADDCAVCELVQRDTRGGCDRHASLAVAGWNYPPFSRFPGMRIREENCNMVLLAAVTLVSVADRGRR